MIASALVFDDTALLALGKGNRLASWITDRAFRAPDRHVLVPALCLLAADAARPGLAEHVGALEALTVVDLDYPAVLSVGKLLTTGMDWRHAHAVLLARPTVDYPAGIPIATTTPSLYERAAVTAIDLT